MAEDRSQTVLNVYKKADGSVAATGTKGAKSATLTGLKPNTAVAVGEYQVSFKGATESEKVDVPAFTVPDAVQSAPTLTVVPGDAVVTYTIKPGKDTGGSAITAYTVSYSSDGSKWIDKSVALASLTGTIDSLTNATEYSFKAVAVNAAGNSAESVVVKATPTAPAAG